MAPTPEGDATVDTAATGNDSSAATAVPARTDSPRAAQLTGARPREDADGQIEASLRGAMNDNDPLVAANARDALSELQD